jgi:hypothetical protein
VEPADVGADVVYGSGAQVDQLLAEAGQKALHDLAPAIQQDVRVAALGHALAVGAGRGKSIALQQGDLPVVVGQGARGEQPGDAGADDGGGSAHLLTVRLH